MDYVQLWNTAISEVLKTTDNEEERKNLELFRQQVVMNIEGRKIVFTCNNSYFWGIFVNYAARLYSEVENLLGNPGYSFGVEVQVNSADNTRSAQAPAMTNQTQNQNQNFNSNSTFSQNNGPFQAQVQNLPNANLGSNGNFTDQGHDLQSQVAMQNQGMIPQMMGMPAFNPNFMYQNPLLNGFAQLTPEQQQAMGFNPNLNPQQLQMMQNYAMGFNMPSMAAQIQQQMLQQQQQASLQDYQDDNAAFNNANRPEIKAHNPTPRAKSSKLAAIEKMFPNFRKRNPINPNKTFENYVIDPENKTLFATAIAVATNPGSSNYNPLYIYGASGLGKTHLLFAIANRIMQLNSDISIIYTRAEEFIRHYVESMASIKKSPFDDQQVHFQDLYTEHDVFIVDDIQNFIKGPKARDAFFDIIAEFIDKPNRQLILASDVPPGNLNGFNARLTTRFGSGVCCEVVPPGVETRTAITISKCEEMKINLSEDVINYIATNVRSNIRELEGAIKTLNSHKLNSEAELTVEEAKKILANLVNASNQVCTIDTIKERVSREFEVTVASMESAEKKKTVSLARSMSMALARDLIPSLSLSDIGRAFNKDHSSVHEAIKRIKNRIDQEPEIASKYNKLTLSLKKE